MESIVEELHHHFVTKPHLDCFPEETAEHEKALKDLSIDQADAVDHLRSNASLTAFRAGLRLGLCLMSECLLPLRPLP